MFAAQSSIESIDFFEGQYGDVLAELAEAQTAQNLSSKEGAE